MRKKIYMLLGFIFLSIFLYSCSKGKIKIDVEFKELNLNINDTYEIEYETNDNKGLIFTVKDESIAMINEEGIVKALKEGKSVIVITSKTNKKVFIEINLNVSDAETVNLELAEGMEYPLNLESNSTYEIDNPYVADIKDNKLYAELMGTTVIKLYSNDILYKIINIKVVRPVNTVELVGPNSFYLDEEVVFDYKMSPINGFDSFRFESSDESIFIIDENGKITPKQAGVATVKIISDQSDDINDIIEVNIKDTVIVSKALNEVTLGSFKFTESKIFKTIEEALTAVDDGGKVVLYEATIEEEFLIDKDVYLYGIESEISSNIKLKANNIIIENISFLEGSKIDQEDIMDSFVFKNNEIINVETDFLTLNNYKDVNINNNIFRNVKEDIITLDVLDYGSRTLIEKNVFEQSGNVITINILERMKINSFIKIYRNKVSDVNAFLINDFNNKNIETNSELYARFNEVTDYNKAVINKDDNNFELTFNYWGSDGIDKSHFENVLDSNLLGFYESKEDILKEDKYKPDEPIIVDLENVIDEIWLGETFKLEPTVLPYTSDSSKVMISVDDLDILNLTRTWELVPIRSGLVKLTVGSFSSNTLRTEYEINVTTDPGIHFELSNQTHDLEVGSKFEINALPYPYNLSDEEVEFKSSNNDIATVNTNGEVEIKGVGEFIITASINGEAIVSESLEFTSYDKFEEDNIMDFITQKQLTYSNMHEITLYGTTHHDVVHNESVTRVLLSDYDIKEKIIPVTPGFRPGSKFNEDIPEEYKFNEDNVVWIVVHDTGNSNAGAGAELHANYLWNQATQNGRQASWHYTVDAYEAWRHLPENEIGYHAGDGSALPGLDKESPALGGGNRNGIGIEMSIQNDGHLFKTWQNTAKLVGDLLYRYNLPLSHQTYHNDFSGKECPQTLRKAGLLDFFEELVENEYNMRSKFQDNIKSITFESHNKEIMDNNGTIIKTPNKTTQVSYTINVELNNGETMNRTFKTIIEGFWR